MSKHNATFLVQNEGESSYKYNYIVKSNQDKALFDFISRVLQRTNNYSSTWTFDDQLNDGLKLQIYIYTPNDIINEAIPESNPQGIIPFNQKALINDKTPIIHIVLSDFLNDNLYGENEKLHPLVPRYYQIIDSSIWNRYVPMANLDDSEDGFCALFTKAVNEIFENYHNELYQLPVAKEHADLTARLVGQSYFDRQRHGHGKYVVPFIFHSETAIDRLIKKEFEELKRGTEKEKWCWRILLVDDKAIVKDNKDFTNPNDNSKTKNNCKVSIICRLIKKVLFPNSKEDYIQYREYKNGQFITENNLDEAKIVIDCVQTHDEAILILKQRKYDLVMLDYLLDGSSIRNYGYEILEKIYNTYICNNQFNNYIWSNHNDNNQSLLNQLDKHKSSYRELLSFMRKKNLEEINDIDIIKEKLKEEQFQIGPDGKLFFIFTSAYSPAVNERLLAQGLNRSEACWYINSGACPTNTPKLFTYNLLKLMEKRLNDCGILKLSSDKILELINKIFLPKKLTIDNSSVRKRASELYLEVLNLQYHFHRLLKDTEIPHYYSLNHHSCPLFDINESVLISHFIHNNQHLSGLLEHLSHLVHIAAFGTIRQWDEMWEEYLYFKAQFRTQKDTDDDFQKVCGYIEEYILGLKSQQR